MNDEFTHISAIPPGDMPTLPEGRPLSLVIARAVDTALRDASTPLIQPINVRTNGNSFVAVATTGRNMPQVPS